MAAGVVGVGAIARVLGHVFERPLDCTDDQRLAASYRTRFFLRIATSETAALAGFAGFVLTGTWWLFPLGAGIAAFGFARVAPTAASLDREHEVLVAEGCYRSVVAALASPPA